MVVGGVEVAPGAFAPAAGATAGADVAAGVFAVTGGGGACVEEGGVAAAGALPAFVALVAPAVGAEVAVSALDVLGALAAGAVAAAVAVAVAGAGAPAAGADAPVAFAGMAVAYALNGGVRLRLAQPSVNAARSIARLALGDRIPKAFESRRIARFD
ncbi:MAG: hypothetical protein QOF46_3114 [Paraburkholderia sp.]|nr:hypothetical protein [Paraburkholderia sp.]